MLRTIQAFNQFYLFYILRPPFPVATLSMLSYSMFRYGQFALSAAINVITVLILLFLVIYINQKARQSEGTIYGL
jgi:ABC-type sugar transport system permease subunit